MGTFFAEVHLASPFRPDRRESVKLLVDSGSMDTWVSAGALRDLGLQPSERRRVLTIGGKSHRTWSQTTSKSWRSEEHTSELQSRLHLVCRLLLEKKKKQLRQHASHAPAHDQ